jgi:fatty acid desaturase
MHASQIEQADLKKENIRRAIREAEKDLRRRMPVLKYQDAIGMAVFIAAITGVIAMSVLYGLGIVPAWLTLLVNMFLLSFLHELEHDLIHYIYFKKNKKVQNAMMWGVWIMRGNIINPFIRRKIHFHHHKVSGTTDDTEERLLGNGNPYNLKRILLTIEPSLGVWIKNKTRGLKTYPYRYIHHFGLRPVTTTFYLVFYLIVIVNLLHWGITGATALAGIDYSSPVWIMKYVYAPLNFFGVVYIFPNIIRQACLNFITASMHYHGDVDDPLKETQVLNHWVFLPFQVFCFNFGATHGIHHLVVDQPFYIREMIKRKAHRAMRANGIRFNDFGTFRRANRYSLDYTS